MLNIPTRTSWFHVFTYILKFCFSFSCCLRFTFVLCLLYFIVRNKVIDLAVVMLGNTSCTNLSVDSSIANYTEWKNFK